MVAHFEYNFEGRQCKLRSAQVLWTVRAGGAPKKQWTITLFWYSYRRLYHIRLELSEDWVGLGKPEKTRQDCKQRI